MTISAVSPGVTFSEIDQTTSVPAISTTAAAAVGVFRWGPINERILVSSEDILASRFGKPTNFNAETFFNSADFLSYSNSLFITRVASDDAYNAQSSNSQISTDEDALEFTGEDFIARYPGELGNSLKVSICPSSNAFSSSDVTDLAVTVGSNTATVTSAGSLAAGDILRVGNTSIGYQDMRVSSVDGTDVEFFDRYRLAGNSGITAERFWGQYNNVANAPDANSIHIVVIDEDGEFSGVAGNILEIYENVSTSTSAKQEDGATNYYKNVVNNQSRYIWATSDDVDATGAAVYTSFTGGTDGDGESDVSIAKLAAGWDLYVNNSDVDVSLLLQGKAKSTTLANYIIDNVCEVRKDCVVFVSPERSDAVNNVGSEVSDMITFRNGLTSSSYAVLDSGYKYRYDKYNDVLRYTPLNGDIAGLTARTDNNREPWFSPAGYNRGIIKNVVSLPFNPTKAQRDQLYVKDINPVITESGRGTLLFGDKTLLGRSSAFNRINVRRLFIILEKAISRASKSTLWELNDEFTRASFKNLVEPFLREVQGRRGIYDFRVVCDETNNTPEVIDRNEFIGDIYIKPARSINFIHLNFVAVRTGIEFEEIVGRAV